MNKTAFTQGYLDKEAISLRGIAKALSKQKTPFSVIKKTESLASGLPEKINKATGSRRATLQNRNSKLVDMHGKASTDANRIIGTGVAAAAIPAAAYGIVDRKNVEHTKNPAGLTWIKKNLPEWLQQLLLRKVK